MLEKFLLALTDLKDGFFLLFITENPLAQNIIKWFLQQRESFIKTFITENRWKYFANGLVVTLQVTFFALIFGIFIGVIVAIVRSSYETMGREMNDGFPKKILKFFNKICKIYLTVIRGTPVVVQIMLIYYVILVSVSNKVLVASIAFGINSGAYVAEIVRGGIMSVDKGQMEAGRSLGLDYIRTMVYIIIPQAFKIVLPSLANEFIVLFKETAISGYIALADLTRAADSVRTRTYEAFFPLISVAIIYLIMVIFFTYLVGILERKLKNSER